MNKTPYLERVAAEQRTFSDCLSVSGSLPKVYSSWSNDYLRPKLQRVLSTDRPGLAKTQQLFLDPMLRKASEGIDPVTVASIGAGNCDAEVELLTYLRQLGVTNIQVHCYDITEAMLTRGRALAADKGVSDRMQFITFDANTGQLPQLYDLVMANHSLHHIMNLEHLFDGIASHLKPDGKFLVHDMIGRNGHMLWPEALHVVESIWHFLPRQYKYNHQWRRYCDDYVNWDCSSDGFEGIRAQDILPLLLQRFGCEMFVGFCNIIDVFAGRGFGHNFDWEKPYDRAFIRFIAETDEHYLRNGWFTPTHLAGWFTLKRPESTLTLDGQVPEKCIHQPVNGPASARQFDSSAHWVRSRLTGLKRAILRR